MKYLINITNELGQQAFVREAIAFVQVQNAELAALYVETKHISDPQFQKDFNEIVGLLKSAGTELRILSDYDILRCISGFISKENINCLILEKVNTRKSRVNQLYQKTDKLTSLHPELSVYILSTNREIQSIGKTPLFSKSDFGQYVICIGMVMAMAALCYPFQYIAGYRFFSLLFLFLVSTMAFFARTGPVLVAATLSALIWNFFFIPPHFTLHINHPEDVMMFFMFFVIALLNGVLTTRLKNQETRIRVREERTYALYQLAKDLATGINLSELQQLVSDSIGRFLGLEARIILPAEISDIKEKNGFHFSEKEQEEIKRCFTAPQNKIFQPSMASENSYAYYPMVGNQLTSGLIVLRQKQAFTYGEEQFWDACLHQISAKFEREILRTMAKNAELLNESDKLYKTLFNSISHELRIPVTTIVGASDTLITENYPPDIQRELLQEISIAGIRLNHVIENLLNMSRLESGHLSVKKDWCDVHDLINQTLEILRYELRSYPISVHIDNEMPLVKIDFGIVQQVIYNLLLNATQYTPQESNISIIFGIENQQLNIVISDEGPGISAADQKLLFEKFYRGNSSRTGGTGLGLSIVKGFVEAHNGQVTVSDNQPCGTKFNIYIPVETSQIDHLKNE